MQDFSHTDACFRDYAPTMDIEGVLILLLNEITSADRRAGAVSANGQFGISGGADRTM